MEVEKKADLKAGLRETILSFLKNNEMENSDQFRVISRCLSEAQCAMIDAFCEEKDRNQAAVRCSQNHSNILIGSFPEVKPKIIMPNGVN